MTGQELYEVHYDVVESYNIGITLPSWDRLSAEQRDDWERQADEQTARDREEVHYDGPNS